jgi:hypothetical protein
VVPSGGRRTAAILPALLGAVLLAPAARALELEKLVMPGPVIAGHADVESQCTRCHTPFRRETENRLCLECHDAVGADVKEHRGFHGLAPAAGEAPCRSCHPDHRGREADVTGLDPDTFDHERTDYPLRGAHRSLPCASCHAPDQKHRDASSDCVGCHREDDPHHGALGQACGDCHRETAWSEWRFDHGKTDFPLEGKHGDVACGLCHPSQRFEETPSACVACHAVDDVHRGAFGRDCERCHTAADWKKTAAFDHDRQTDFPLAGAHERLACAACHTGPLHAQKLPTDCLGCHRADDEHGGRFGKDCGKCHGEAAWSPPRFDHDRDTDFPLRGAHRETRCEDCHRGTLFVDRTARSCTGCHAADDVHRGQEGDACESCHGETSWKLVRFDHDQTRFPLLGLHAGVPCESCHPSPTYRDAELACKACHADDFHQGRLGGSCELCHNPNGWKVWRFDHDVQTKFALHGAHQGVDCHACHTQPVGDAGIHLARDCVPCHAADDAHRGGFGARCDRCHTEGSWRDLRLRP